jgi:triphosphatase
MLSICHQFVMELQMSEADTRSAAGETARALAAQDGDSVGQDKSGIAGPIVSAGQRAGLQGTTAHVEETLRDETASENVTAVSEASSSRAATPPDREIELKLLVDADRLAGFNTAPVIAANARNKGARKHFKSAYYDTPTRTLWRNGLSLRVRQSGTRFVQTVKTESGDDPLRRGEWEASVPSMAPDIGLALPFLPAKIRSGLERRPLEAVFTSDIHRHVRLVDLPSGTVEVAFDRGTLKAADRSIAVSEIELELKAGSAGAIYELAFRLVEHGPLRPSIRSKSARGFDLAADAPPAAKRPRRLRLDPSTTLDQAFVTILQSCFRHLLQSLPAAEDGRNPEGVHQLRVSLRRLRSALDLMRSVGSSDKLDSLRSEAKWLAQSLSAARDWDIFQGETLPTVAKACPLVAGFDDLEQAAESRRQAAYDKARLALADRRCACFLLGLGGWIEARGWRSDIAPEDIGRLAEPAIGFARQALSSQHAKVLKRGRHFKSLTSEQLHRLRLAGKRMRYIADFLLPLCADRKSAKRFSRSLAGLQEELGCFNDMTVTAALFEELGAVSTESSTAAAAIIGWQAHASADAGGRLREAWRDFTKAKAPWSTEAKQ